MALRIGYRRSVPCSIVIIFRKGGIRVDLFVEFARNIRSLIVPPFPESTATVWVMLAHLNTVTLVIIIVSDVFVVNVCNQV